MASSSSMTRTSSAASSSAPLITSSHPLAPLKAQEIKRVLRLWEVDPKLILDASTKKELIELAELHGITGAPDEWTLQKKKDERTRLQKLPDHFLQRLRAIFDAFDYDHSGAIEVHELDQILREMNIQGQDAQALLTEVDADGNGVLDFDEFVAIFNKPTSGLASAFAASGHFDAGGLFDFVSSRFGGSGGNTSGTGARVKLDLK